MLSLDSQVGNMPINVILSVILSQAALETQQNYLNFWYVAKTERLFCLSCYSFGSDSVNYHTETAKAIGVIIGFSQS